MNVLDLLLVVFLLLAGAGGYAAGFIRRAAAWAGFAVGALLGWKAAEYAAREVEIGGGAFRVLAAFAIVLLAGSIGGAVGESIGWAVRRTLPRGPARAADAVAGGLLGVFAVLVGAWLAFPVLAQVPGGAARLAHTSAIIDAVRDIAPTAPRALQTLGDRLGEVRFPDVNPLQRAPDLGRPPSSGAVPDSVVINTSASTVSIEAFGCGGGHEGSGWVAADDTVMTNAHVVAGADRVRVRRPDQRVMTARVVFFDDDRDVAVLEVPGLGLAPLPVGEAAVGGEGVVIGYPGGVNRPVVAPAAIRREQQTVGRDIYRRDVVRRQVLYLAARLRPGDSGAPLIDDGGAVVGMAFAIAADRSTTAYALDDSELRAAIGAPPRPGTGACV